MILFFVLTGADFEEENLLIAIIPALLLAALSAFYTVHELKKESVVISEITGVDELIKP